MIFGANITYLHTLVNIPSYTGEHYFLAIVDDYLRATWVYLMKYKSDTYSYLTNFCTMVHTQFGLKVRHIRPDKGLEFTSKLMQEFFHKHGILHQ